VPAARAAHAVVELNGRQLGIYVLLESVDREFLGRYFKNTHGNVYGQGPNADINQTLELMGGDEKNNGQDLKALAAACGETDPARLRVRLPQVLDLERFLSFMALETLLGHWDGYTFNVKNYSVYHDLDTDKMVFLPHDLDQLLRSTEDPIEPQARGMVARAVLQVPEFRERFRARIEELITNVFVAPVLIQRIDERAAQLAVQLKTTQPELAGEFVSRASSLKNRLQARARNLAGQLPPPAAGMLKFAENSARLTGWRAGSAADHTKQATVPDAAGKPSLWIAATGASAGSWRTTVVLPPGRYAFEGRARTAGVKPVPNDAQGEGAGLRISGQSRTAKLVGDAPWTQMRFEFEVTEARSEAVLICELRATQGEAWFDEASLRLVRR
jgi:hypothetical protein